MIYIRINITDINFFLAFIKIRSLKYIQVSITIILKVMIK